MEKYTFNFIDIEASTIFWFVIIICILFVYTGVTFDSARAKRPSFTEAFICIAIIILSLASFFIWVHNSTLTNYQDRSYKLLYTQKKEDNNNQLDLSTYKVIIEDDKGVKHTFDKVSQERFDQIKNSNTIQIITWKNDDKVKYKFFNITVQEYQ